MRLSESLVLNYRIFLIALFLIVPILLLDSAVAERPDFVFDVYPDEVENEETFYITILSNITNESYQIDFKHSKMGIIMEWSMLISLREGRFVMDKQFTPDIKYGKLQICVRSIEEVNNTACETIKLVYSDAWQSYLDAYNHYLFLKANEEHNDKVFWTNVYFLSGYLIMGMLVPLILVARLYHKNAIEQGKPTFMEVFTKRRLRPLFNKPKLHILFRRGKKSGHKVAKWELEKQRMETINLELESVVDDLAYALDERKKNLERMDELQTKIDKSYQREGLM